MANNETTEGLLESMDRILQREGALRWIGPERWPRLQQRIRDRDGRLIWVTVPLVEDQDG
jgi:hypothetical protein